MWPESWVARVRQRFGRAPHREERKRERERWTHGEGLAEVGEPGARVEDLGGDELCALCC